MSALAELICGDPPDAWARLGFAVEGGGLVRIGAIAVRCDGAGGGLRGWVLSGEGGPGELDGIATRWSVPAAPAEPPPGHPNGAGSLDHVVVFTDDHERTSAALVAAGGDQRRRAGPPQVPVAMAFVRLGGAIVEVAEAGGPPRLWGIVAVVDDLGRAAAELGELLGPARDAVQPGRRIATVRPAAGLGSALAFMTPR